MAAASWRMAAGALGCSPAILRSRSPFLRISATLSSPALTTRFCAPVVSLVLCRDFHALRFSRNMEFFTSSDVPLPKKTMEVARALGERERPLTLLFCWLMAKERHVRKYAQLYTNLGIDVLKVRVSPFDLLRPTKGSQVAADQVLQFLHANPSHSPVLIHGFSVGGYVFSEVMVKVENDFKKHGHLLNRFVGQIWDSGVDIDGIPDGMPRAITNNALLQKSMKKYLEWYLKIQYDTATIHYERASQKMHQNFVGVPGLFLFSDNDPVSTPEMNARVYKKWESKGHQVYTGHWQKSPHVTHFQRHPVEYQELMVAFLERVGMIEPARQRATSI
ncbi:transmembrane protein 53-B-like [Penaeus chinensis]|uniref:transmembrane protein 53-B-like n=1 Tax=Penaeus chinensis TaxID=139456 RepID=UPI001FB700CF|nr:transmembrane protein 53-B-like [Penaeus chinensis]XP_047492771.1 transmembrane protein 53-B-like [Penaeus chinensis]